MASVIFKVAFGGFGFRGIAHNFSSELDFWVVTGLTGLGYRSDRSDRLVHVHSTMQVIQIGLTGRLHRSDRLMQTEPCTMRSNVLFSAISSMIRISVAVMIMFM